jgi:hypothetical protein
MNQLPAATAATEKRPARRTSGRHTESNKDGHVTVAAGGDVAPALHLVPSLLTLPPSGISSAEELRGDWS